MVINLGGRGKKSPWESVMVRCPEPIKPDVQRFINEWKVSQASSPPVATADPAPTTPDLAAAIAVLEQALTMRANAGGAIKAEIRKALDLLT